VGVTRTLSMRNIAFLFTTICALAALFAFAGNAGAVTRTGGTGTDPWIASDLPDYGPGQTVNLLGGSWQPGEAVHINVDDADSHTWTRDVDVNADANGDISDSFTLPDWFVTNYFVTATGASSGTATAHFTDAAIQTTTTLGSSLNPSELGDSVTFTATVTCDSACDFTSSHNVDFYDGGNNCNGTLLASHVALTGSGSIIRQASFATSSLASGAHSIMVCFNGGGSGNSPKSSISAPLSQVVHVGAPAKLGFAVQPTAEVIDNSITPAVQVAVQDASGTTVTSSGASITIALGSNPGGATLSGTTTVNAVNGVATFSDLSLDRAGTGYTLAASSSGLTGATSTSFNITKRTTSTTFSCTPNTVGIGSTTSCTATVTDTATGTASAPLGTVTWTLPSGASGPSGCNLAPASGSSSSCSATETITTANNKQITGISYGGGTKHLTSTASNYTINVVPTGTMTVDRTSVTAGSTNTFVFTFTASQLFSSNSRVKLDIPAGWTAPTAGNTTLANTSCGGSLSRSISGQSVTVAMGSGCVAGNKFTLTYSSATAPSTTGDYTFTTSTALSSGSFAEIATSPIVTVTPACTAPSVTTQPTDQSITYGANASFAAAATGSPAPTVKWQVNSGSGFTDMSPAQTNTTLTLTKPAVSLSGNQYRAVFSNTCGGIQTATTTAATLTVGAKNLTINGAAANSRSYDSTTGATVDFTAASLNGVVSGDTVTINSSGYSASFANKNVGAGKAVTVTGVALGGADAPNYNVSQPSGLTADITAKELSVSFEAQNKTYDGNTTAAIKSSPAPSLVGVVAGDTVSLDGSSASASFVNENVGTGKTVTASGFTKSGADAGNYVFASPQGTTTADITAKNLTINGVSVNDKTYDATGDATIDWSGAGLNGVVGSDDVSIDHSASAAHFNNKNVGTSKPVTVTGAALSGTDAGNYTVSQPSGLSADITAKNLTISGAAANNRIYDSTDGATVDFTAASLNGVVSGDTVTIDHSGYLASFANKNVGTGKPVTVVGVVLGGADASNYTVSQPTGLTANITARDLTVSATGVNKTYDGTADATVTLSTDKLSGDTVSSAYSSASFEDKNVGNDKDVSVSGISISGADAGNYHLTNTTASTKADITAGDLTVTAHGENKVYDGTPDATVTLSTDKLSGDTVTADYTSASFGNKNVGTGKTVSVSGITVSGADAGNYHLTNTTASTTAGITARDLTVAAHGVDKIYDGTTDATVTLTSDKVAGDTVSLAYTSASFANKDVGSDKDVSVSGISISGADAGNYDLQNTTDTTTASISQRSITVSAVSDSKVYDGDVNSDETPTISSGTLATGDTGNFAQHFANKDVATGKTLIPTGSVDDGNAGNNYDVAFENSSNGEITARDLTVTAHGVSKVYDGTPDATVTLTTDELSGDAVTAAYTSASFADRHASTSKAVNVTGISISGGDSGNYNLTNTTASTSADISERPITVTAVTDSKTYDGTTSSDETPTISSGSIASGDTANFGQAFATKTVGTGKALVPSGSVLDGNAGDDYDVAFQNDTTGVITAKGLTVSGITAADKVYDGNRDASLDVTDAELNGVASNDSVTLNTASASGLFDTKNVGADKDVQVSGLTISGTDAGNYSLAQPVVKAAISAENLTISGLSAQDRVYNGGTGATISGTPQLHGVVGTEDVSLSGTASGTFASKDVGTHDVTVSGLSLSGSDKDNYSLTLPTLSATISVKDLSVGFEAQNKTYDGGDLATIKASPAPSFIGKVAGDDLTLGTGSAVAHFGNKNVGTGKTVTGSGFTKSGADAGNYAFSSPQGTTTADISTRDLTVSASGVNKTYDGTTDAAVTLSTDKLSGDIVNAAYTSASVANKNAGTGKTVSVSGISISGADASNYHLTNTTASTSADINKRPITVSAVTDSKVYDGTTNSNGHPTISSGTIVSGDTGNFSQAFLTKAVGTGKTLVASGSVADGNNGDNYDVTFVTNTTGVITTKSLTVAGITATDKPWDGTTAATINVTGASLVGVISGDAVALNTSGASGAFIGSSAGTCGVQVSGLGLLGSDSGNYSLSQPVVTACIGAWNATGFYAPVGVGNSQFVTSPGTPPAVSPVSTIWNTAKGGSTVPLKFNLYSSQGGAERTNVADIRSFDVVSLSCSTGEGEDSVDFTTSGSTTLRYDTTAMQFIQNWKTPTASTDKCYRVNVKFLDGSAIYAFFKLKR
jgi:hypothetical protein